MGGDSEHRQFFRRRETREAIELLAGRDRVTIVVGAGASAEVGLPLWPELVERLLLRALSPDTPADSLRYGREIREASAKALAEGGELGAATMARAVLDDRFDEELRRCLYEWPYQWQWDRPGATAYAVAKLFKVMRSQDKICEVATTNYDVKLEEALEEALGEPVKPSCVDSEDPDGVQVVRHLHGVLTEDGESRDVTLTEADYHAVDSGLPWQESYLRRRLEDSIVVFIGASLTDQHMLRYIFRYATPERPPIALLVEEPESGDVDGYPTPNEAEILFSSLKQKRWEYAHLVALETDFRSQPAQFLHEVVHHKESTSALRYGERLDSWYRAISKDRLGLTSEEGFRVSQHLLQEIVEDWLDAVTSTLEDAGYDLSNEMLAVHLWCRCPDRLRAVDAAGEGRRGPLSSMAMMGCSDRTWVDPRAIDVRLITQPSSRAAVDAFCWGTPQIQFPQGRPKWNWILATPVVLEDDQLYGRLPVGAVTLVSDCASEESVLLKMRRDQQGPELLAEIENFLASVAEDALMPPNGSD